jgi:YebC/PmpR family DNA-binding regulatory protein
MAGHSKWAQIKHKKAVVDARRGKLFSKLAKEISVAARLGGGDPDMNPRLRAVIEKAKAANMPQENIKRAIQKGTGELPGAAYEEVIYEGYGPGGVALMIYATTDNKNRTVAEIRHLMSKHGGSLGEAGCVSWMFDKKGYILVPKTEADEDTLMAVVLDAGAEDLKNEPDSENYEIITGPSELHAVKEAIEAQGIKVASAEVAMLPKSQVRVEGPDAEKLLRLLEALEDHDDVQNIYSNFDIPDEVMAQAGA